MHKYRNAADKLVFLVIIFQTDFAPRLFYMKSE